MRVLLLAILLAEVAYHCRAIIFPQFNMVTLSDPERTPVNETPSSYLVVCHVMQENIIEFNSTWVTPGGVTIEVNQGQFTVSTATDVGDHDYSILLSINKLSYQNAGTYTCSASYTVNGSLSVVTNKNASVILTFPVSVEAFVTPLNVTVGDSVSLSCEMARYLRPDSAFKWKKSEKIIEASDKFNIAYSNLFPGRGQNGGEMLDFSRASMLTINSLELSDAGDFICFVEGTEANATITLSVEPFPITSGGLPITTSTATATVNDSSATGTNAPGTTFPIPAVAAIAGLLGLVVLVLIVLIIVVSIRKKKKSSTITLEPLHDRELNENTAYESASGSNNLSSGSMPSRPLPKYAIIEKHSISPAPPIPARPSTNLSIGNNNAAADRDYTPPGYDTPMHTNSTSDKSHSVTIDPYYDNPDDVKPPPPIPKFNPKGRGGYYDEVELGGNSLPYRKPEALYDITTVPSPAAVLSGTLQRALGHSSPDFVYPPLNNDAQNDREHDYDQIYSEPLDPNIIRQDYEFENNEAVAIPYSAIYEDPVPFQDSFIPLRVTHKDIVELKQLGMGQFGHVILAQTIALSMKDLKLSDTDTEQSSILVAIKKLKTDADGCLVEAFDKEVKFMARLSHDNVIRLLGVCTSGESFIMMEYMENGDLNQFLTKQVLMPDTISGLQESEVTPIILLYMGVQIASGMHYLSSLRFVHRDLATRNCLVGKDFVVKISDFGMSRSLYESAYYRVQGTLVLPIRWMACETFYGKFSVKSDAWAFGVSLWEIYTLGKVDPYDHMTDEEVIADAIKGSDRLILEKPPSCPQDVYDIMLRCWVHEPSMRADFGYDSLSPTTGTVLVNATTEDEKPTISLGLFIGLSFIGILMIVAGALSILGAVGWMARRKSELRSSVDVRQKYTVTPTIQVNSSPAESAEPRSRPIYSKVAKKKKPALENSGSPPPPLPPPLRLSSDSPPVAMSTAAATRSKPQEIVAYDFEISKTFMPYAPPPPVHGLISNENHKFSQSQNPYNIQVESLADYDEVEDSIEGSLTHLSPWKRPQLKQQNSWNSSPVKGSPAKEHVTWKSSQSVKEQYTGPLFDSDSYYDTVESIKEEVTDLTSSIRSNVSFPAIDEGHYQSPRRKLRRYSRESNRGSDAALNTYTEQLEPSMLFQPPVSSDESEAAIPYGPVYARPKTMKRSDKPLEISYHHITEIRNLGVSKFGNVVLAATVNLSLIDLKLGDSNDRSRSFLVAIKKLKDNVDCELKNAFHDEIKCMMRLKHANVVRLLGICSMGSPPFSMVEYMENGDLQEFLQKQKLVSDDTACLAEGETTPLILLYMAVQIASGMRYLSSRKFIHRDLAARNCLVGREFVVKISEFGMSRSIYSPYYFRVQGQLILPIRWMAYESFYGKFSMKSDVWSFGITLWEIYQMAAFEPYPGMSNKDVINNAMKGPKRIFPEKPELCPDEVFDVMKRCWVHEPSMRAAFEEIYSRLFLAYVSRSQEASS